MMQFILIYMILRGLNLNFFKGGKSKGIMYANKEDLWIFRIKYK